MARVLITRAQPQAGATAELVRARGFQPVVLPLTQTEVLEDGLAAVAALGAHPTGVMVVTSARAIEALIAAGQGPCVGSRRWAVVGERAGALLNGLGAQLVEPPAKDVMGLIDVLHRHRGPLTYLAGADRKPTLEERFPTMRVIPVYRAKTLGGFSEDAAAQLAADPPAYAVVFSARGAQLLAEAIAKAGLQDKLAAMQWACLSPDVARHVPQGKAARIAKAPTQAALLALLR